jgi:hypothetical protein
VGRETTSKPRGTRVRCPGGREEQEACHAASRTGCAPPHKRSTAVCVLDELGREREHRNVKGHPRMTVEFLRGLQEPLAVCYEASCGYPPRNRGVRGCRDGRYNPPTLIAPGTENGGRPYGGRWARNIIERIGTDQDRARLDAAIAECGPGMGTK